MSRSRFKLFIENFAFYGGLSMLTKALPFLTLPILTRMLPDTSSYGKADMFNLIISFGSALAVLGMYDAIFREFFEDKENKEYQKNVTATGFNIVLMSSLIICLLIFIFNEQLSLLFFDSVKYKILITISSLGILLSSISSILASPTRMNNQRKVFLYTGVSFPLIGFISTYIFIKIGYTYEAIIYGTIIMNLISTITFGILNKRYFNIKILDKKIAKELFKIGLPLVPTFLIYWIFRSMDRIMINKILGASQLGIYSVGSKVASVSQLIYTAFAGGWSYFAFSTMKDKDQVELNSKVFEYLGVISFLAFILAQPFIKPIFNLFFKGEYQNGYTVFSYLFLSPLILMLFQVIANQVIVIKKSYLSTLALIFGAILNIVLNYLLINRFGIKGAALSTLISYITSVIIMIIICIKYKLLKVKLRFVLISLILLNTIMIKFVLDKDVYMINGLYILMVILIISFYINDFKKKIKE